MLVVLSAKSQSVTYNNEQLNALRSASIEQKTRMLTDTMCKYLHLTNSQVKQVYTLNLTTVQTTHEIMKNDDSKLSKYFAIKSHDEERDESLKVILTNSQFVLYQTIKERIIKEIKDRRNARE